MAYLAEDKLVIYLIYYVIIDYLSGPGRREMDGCPG